MITAYATLKKAAANANHAGGQLDDLVHGLIVQACDEILAGSTTTCSRCMLDDRSGTQFNMNVTRWCPTAPASSRVRTGQQDAGAPE